MGPLGDKPAVMPRSGAGKPIWRTVVLGMTLSVDAEGGWAEGRNIAGRPSCIVSMPLIGNEFRETRFTFDFIHNHHIYSSLTRLLRLTKVITQTSSESSSLSVIPPCRP